MSGRTGFTHTRTLACRDLSVEEKQLKIDSSSGARFARRPGESETKLEVDISEGHIRSNATGSEDLLQIPRRLPKAPLSGWWPNGSMRDAEGAGKAAAAAAVGFGRKTMVE
ncbi:hypothetical protein RB195_008631 [Necator americanus]|uniref:Uncharacterized protein n=1 Tax=Necator americanus TaxID=51031 RepID=A0ABR1CPL2_NECAM